MTAMLQGGLSYRIEQKACQQRKDLWENICLVVAVVIIQLSGGQEAYTALIGIAMFELGLENRWWGSSAVLRRGSSMLHSGLLPFSVVRPAVLSYLMTR